MGRPKDAKERQWQRAAEDLDRALRRKDAPGAAEHLLVLPRERREALLPQVVALFRADVQRAYSGGDLGKLSKWVVWAEMEPRLLEGQDPEVLWPLALGAARSRDWQRAEKMLASLAPDLRQRAAALHGWLAAWIEHRGQVPQELAPKLGRLPVRASAAAQQPDPRLGYEPVRKVAVAVAAPKIAQDAAQAVLRLFATERRPALLRDVLSGWLRLSLPGQAGRQLNEVLALHAVPLLVREALLLRRDGRPVAVPLLMMGELMASADFAPQALSGDVSTALRLASTALPMGALPDTADKTLEALKVLLGVAGIAARYQEHRQAVADRLVRTQLPKEVGRWAVPLLRELLLRCPGPALLAQAVKVWSVSAAGEEETLPEAPEWLRHGVEQVLGQGEGQGGEFMAWLRRAGSSERNQLLMAIGLSMPVALGDKVLERAFAGEGPDEDNRRDLARLLVSLLRRRDSSATSAAARARGIYPEKATFGDLRNLIMGLEEQPPLELMTLVFSAPRNERLPRDLWPIYTSLALAERDDEPLLLSRAQQGLIERFGERLLPYHTDLLRLVLRQSPDRARKLRLIEVYLAPRKDIEARLEVLQGLCCQSCEPTLFPLVEERMLTDYAADAEALSRAFRRLQLFDAQLQSARRVARALLEADAGYAGPRTPEYLEALTAAQQIAPRARRAAQRVKVPKPAQTTRPAEPRPARAIKAKAAKAPEPEQAPAAPDKGVAPRKGRAPGASK